MKQELIKKINPVIENFVDDVLKSFDNLDKIRKDLVNSQRIYQDLVDEKQKEVDDTKKLKSESKAEIDQKITDLENAKIDFSTKAKVYEDLSNEVISKKKGIDDTLAKTRMELVHAKDARVRAEKIEQDAKDGKARYELKLNTLKGDTEKIAKKQEKQESEDKKLKIRENNIFINETKNANRGTELSDQELRIKVRQKEVNGLIKKHKLEEFIKE